MPKVTVIENGKEVELPNPSEVIVYHRNKFLEYQMKGKIVIGEKDREYEQSKQSLSKYYLQPQTFSDHALRDWQVFKHDIGKNSGKHKHQGGLVIFC
ncbi:hypothetical protein ACFL0M_15240, partial [Thermodesulfobacteriota bacterium]